MRSIASVTTTVFLASALLLPCASLAQHGALTQQSVDDLAARASHAQPREQCFLYAQLVQQMTELSVRQYSAGNVDKAMDSLHGIQQFARKIHLSLASDDKRLKDAEILLSQTAFRLNEMLRSSSYEDRPLVQETLAQVSQAQDEALTQMLRPQ